MWPSLSAILVMGLVNNAPSSSVEGPSAGTHDSTLITECSGWGSMLRRCGKGRRLPLTLISIDG